eukprot:GEMP01035632.1.p1 GENE.GEMP01035632.1~~GEMP01035632.1.p1  ORF type:complete len:527 (+),score=128.17 GEMP01035632.1:82-1662(+)
METAVQAIRREIESFGKDGKPACGLLAESSKYGAASLRRRLLRRLAFSTQQTHQSNKENSNAIPVPASCVPEVAVFAYVAKCLLNAGAKAEECLTFLGTTPIGLIMRKQLLERTIWFPDIKELSPLCHYVLSLLTMVAAMPITHDDPPSVPPCTSSRTPEASRPPRECSVRISKDEPERGRTFPAVSSTPKGANAHQSTMSHPRSPVDADQPSPRHLDRDEAPHPPRDSEPTCLVANDGVPPSSDATRAHPSAQLQTGECDMLAVSIPTHAETTSCPSRVSAVDIMHSKGTRCARKQVLADTKAWWGTTMQARFSSGVRKHVDGEASKASRSRILGMLVLFDEPLGLDLLRGVASLPQLGALSRAQRTTWCPFDVALDFVRGIIPVSEQQLYERIKIATDHHHMSTRSYWDEVEVDVARTLESSAMEELLHCVGNMVLLKMDAEQLQSQMQRDEMEETSTNLRLYAEEIARTSATLAREKSAIASLEKLCAESQMTMSYIELVDHLEVLKKQTKNHAKPTGKKRKK